MLRISFSGILVLFLFLSNVKSYSQDHKPVFLGIQPGITKEDFYEDDEFDINILPFVFQTPVGKRVDIRLTSIINYHFGTDDNISDVGIFGILPVYIMKKEKVNLPSYGFYIGPLLGLGRNLMNEHNTLTVGIEPGYMFPTKKRFSVTLGLQIGGSYFDYDSQSDLWRNHFGIKVNLGFWLNN